jgi:hypothetical protein
LQKQSDLIKSGQPLVKIYKGMDITVVMKPSGEWVTILKQGEGMYLAIQMIK